MAKRANFETHVVTVVQPLFRAQMSLEASLSLDVNQSQSSCNYTTYKVVFCYMLNSNSRLSSLMILLIPETRSKTATNIVFQCLRNFGWKIFLQIRRCHIRRLRMEIRIKLQVKPDK